MFDGVRGRNGCINFDEWRNKISESVTLHQQVDTTTGAIKTKIWSNHETTMHIGEFETYRLTVREVQVMAGGRHYWLKIDGSLHKNHHGGRNHARFTFSQLKEEINHLCSSLALDPSEITIIQLEFGVNIKIDESPIAFINRQVLMHKTVPFIEYDEKDGRILGRLARHSHYSVKIYDKSLQFWLPYHLLRFELRYTNTEQLRKLGINTLADLLIPEKVFGLVRLLKKAWNEVLLCYPEKAVALKDQLQCYQDYWVKLHEKQPLAFKRARENFRKKNGNKLQERILGMIEAEWDLMING